MKKLMFAAVAALSFVVLAQEAEGPKPEDGGRVRRGARVGERRSLSRGDRADAFGERAVWAVMNPRVAEKIGLSEEIRTQLKKIEEENRAKVRELQPKVSAAMARQAELMKAEKIDEAAVMAVIDELFDCRKEVSKAQARRTIAVKTLLTPEQLEKAGKEMMSFAEGRRAQRLGRKPEAAPAVKPVEMPAAEAASAAPETLSAE